MEAEPSTLTDIAELHARFGALRRNLETVIRGKAGAVEVLAFARRAEADGANVYAAWYRDYARCRYGAPITAEAIAELEAALPAQ